MHAAVEAGNLARLQGILDEQEDDDAAVTLLNAPKEDCKENKITPLMRAALLGNATVGSVLVESGANLEAVDSEGNTALMISCKANKRLVTSMLMWGMGANGVELTAVNQKGNTALHEAAESGAADCAYLIVENGGEALSSVRNGEGLTPLQICKAKGHSGELLAILEGAGGAGDRDGKAE